MLRTDDLIASNPQQLEEIIGAYGRLGSSRAQDLYDFRAGETVSLPGRVETPSQAYTAYQAMYLAIQVPCVDRAMREIYIPRIQDELVGHASRSGLVPFSVDIALNQRLIGAHDEGRITMTPLDLGIVLGQLGTQLRGSENFHDAIEVLNRAQELLGAPGGDAVYAANAARQQAFCLEAAGNLDEAIEASRRCIQFARRGIIEADHRSGGYSPEWQLGPGGLATFIFLAGDTSRLSRDVQEAVSELMTMNHPSTNRGLPGFLIFLRTVKEEANPDFENLLSSSAAAYESDTSSRYGSYNRSMALARIAYCSWKLGRTDEARTTIAGAIELYRESEEQGKKDSRLRDFLIQARDGIT